MTVAVSRARLGLYVLGRREVFEACPELRPAFDILLERPDKLMLVTGELWPSKRLTADEGPGDTLEGEVAMESVEHIGQYVFEMTNTRIKQLQGGQKQGQSVSGDEAMAIPEEEGEDDGDTGAYFTEGAEGGADVEPDIQEVREGEA
jgi:intron-binding protein aquarius